MGVQKAGSLIVSGASGGASTSKARNDQYLLSTKRVIDTLLKTDPHYTGFQNNKEFRALAIKKMHDTPPTDRQGYSPKDFAEYCLASSFGEYIKPEKKNITNNGINGKMETSKRPDGGTTSYIYIEHYSDNKLPPLIGNDISADINVDVNGSVVGTPVISGDVSFVGGIKGNENLNPQINSYNRPHHLPQTLCNASNYLNAAKILYKYLPPNSWQAKVIIDKMRDIVKLNGGVQYFSKEITDLISCANAPEGETNPSASIATQGPQRPQGPQEPQGHQEPKEPDLTDLNSFPEGVAIINNIY